MTMESLTPCANNEDFKVLAAMAITGNWRPLVTREVSPRYMTARAREVAEQLLLTQATQPHAWPPSYAGLRVAYPDCPWPDGMDVPNLPLEPYVEAFSSHARYAAGMSIAMQLNEYARLKTSEARESADMLLSDAFRQLTQIGKKEVGVTRFGEDSEETFARITGTYSRVSQIVTPWEPLNQLIKNFYPGIYAFYALPKSGKSNLLIRQAVYTAFDQKIPTIIVDVENNKDMLYTRLACTRGGLPYFVLEDIKARLRDPSYRLTEFEQRVWLRLDELVEEIRSDSHLYIMGMEAMDPVRKMISTDAILREADRVGADLIAVDQIQKFYVPNVTTSRTDDNKRALQVAGVFSSCGTTVFATTQENREGEPPDAEFKWHSPSRKHVYGSDALSQLCCYLGHVRTLKVESGHDYTDVFGVPRHARHVQCIWPLNNRNGEDSGIEHRFFRIIDNYGCDICLDSSVGQMMYEHEFERRKIKFGYDDKRGGKGSRGPGGGRRGRGSDAGHSIPNPYDRYSG